MLKGLSDTLRLMYNATNNIIMDVSDMEQKAHTSQTGQQKDKTGTKELLEALKISKDIRVFREENLSSFVDISLKDYLEDLIASRNLKRSDIIKASGLTEAYAYQIFAGLKSPSRDKMISLVLGMNLNLEECQKLLRLSGVNELYVKNRRDLVIIFAIVNGLSIPELNDLLFEFNEFTL